LFCVFLVVPFFTKGVECDCLLFIFSC
jgi:hypothetical protein